jgi:3-oxoadipate enol-lactonase
MQTMPTQLAFRAAGDGPAPVVFVHGMCQSSVFWQPTLDQLPTGFSGYAVDLPGFGESANIPGPFSIEGHADAVADFIRSHAPHDAVLVGNSMGGVVCQMLAIRHPGLIGKLVLVASGPNVPDVSAGLAAADKAESGPWDEATALAYVGNFFARPPADLAPYVAAALQATRDARSQSMRSSARTDLRDRLPSITVPTLIVQGEQDRGRTPEVGALMASLIPNATLHIVPGAGHTPMLEDPDLWTRLFHQFLAGGG